jgi:integrase
MPMATVIIQRRKGMTKISYQVYFKEPLTGKRKYYKTYHRLKEAQQAANDLRAIIDSGKPPEKKIKKMQLMTFKEVAESLKTEWNRKLLRGDISEKTHANYHYWLNILIRKYGNTLLCQITEKNVEDYVNNRAIINSRVTSNKYLYLFKKIFQQGLSLNAIVENPVANIKKMSEKDHELRRFLLPRELDRLVKAAQNSRSKFYLTAFIYLGAEHGACKQEIIDLKWRDIDFDFDEKGIIRLFRTKNKRERVEHLMPRTRQALLEWRDHLEYMRNRKKITKIKSDHVFCRLDGTPKKCFNRAWWGCLKQSGIKDFRFHDLRHTFASNLLLSGTSLKDVKEMIGHKDIAMTDRYSHLTLAHKLQKQKQLAAHYANNS